MRSQRHTKKISIQLLLVSIFFFGVTCSLTIGLISIITQLASKNNEHELLVQTLKSKEAEYIRYEQDVKQLQVPEYLAKYARERYSLSKEGEIIFKTD